MHAPLKISIKLDRKPHITFPGDGNPTGILEESAEIWLSDDLIASEIEEVLEDSATIRLAFKVDYAEDFTRPGDGPASTEHLPARYCVFAFGVPGQNIAQAIGAAIGQAITPRLNEDTRRELLTRLEVLPHE